MGRSASVPQLVSKLDVLTREVASNRSAIQATAAAAKVIMASEAARKGVGRGVGRSPISRKIGVSYDLRGGERNASAVVRYTGPAHLVNNPTKPHVIEPKRGRGIVIPGVGVRRSARHPGTKGLKFAQRAADRCRDECPKVYRREGIQAPLRKAFK